MEEEEEEMAEEVVRSDKSEGSGVSTDLVEFGRAVEKVHTHTPFCPNCHSVITKVVLRRRRRREEQEVDNNDILRIQVCLDNTAVTTLQLSPWNNNLRVEDVRVPGLANAVINYIGNVRDGIDAPTLKRRNIGERVGVNENVRIDPADEEIIESEFARVEEKVHTHTPFCPNCRSQITKVILRRRKRGSRHPHEVGGIDAEILAADFGDELDRGPDVFRCLSCFSFFIPTGDGFKLFRAFGEKSGKENVRDEQAPSIKKNWFNSIFAANKQETALEQDQLKESQSSQEVHIHHESDLLVTALPMRTQVTMGESAEDAVSFSQEDGSHLLLSGDSEISEEVQIPNQTVQLFGVAASTKSESETSEHHSPRYEWLPDDTSEGATTPMESEERRNPNFQLLLGNPQVMYRGEIIGYEYEKTAKTSSGNTKEFLGLRTKLQRIADSAPLYLLHTSRGGTSDPVSMPFKLKTDVLYQVV